jgi:hypothetical protein
MNKPTVREFLSNGRWMQKTIDAYSRVARKEANSTLAPMVEFRAYTMALLAYTTDSMEAQAGDRSFDREIIETQEACLQAFVQSSGCTERLILEAQYIKAAAALKQDFELLTRILEAHAGCAIPNRTPNIRHAPEGSQRFYGQLNQMAHPSNLDAIFGLMSAPFGGASTMPVFKGQISRDFYNLHIWICDQMARLSLGFLILIHGEDDDRVREGESWLPLLEKKAEGLFVEPVAPTEHSE